MYCFSPTDLAFQIIQMDENPNLKAKHLMDYLDNEKSTLHLLDEKPTAFRSGIHLGLFKKIIYNCKTFPAKNYFQVHVTLKKSSGQQLCSYD